MHGSRRVYESEWMNVDLDDVEVPDGPRFEHHVLRLPYPSVGAVVTDDDRVLLMWRHRFATGKWGWEIPAGRCEADEEPQDTVVREVEEETGYRISVTEPLVTFHPLSGLSSHTTHVFHGTKAVRTGEPDPMEADRVDWVPAKEIRPFIQKGLISDGITLAALTTYLLLQA